jgi:ethanolamine utilization protein EutN
MFLGKVVGCVWATQKDKALEGQRLLLIQPLNPRLEPIGKRIVCTDASGAGSGEIIYWCRGKESSFPFLPTEVPTDTTVVGIVDSVHLSEQKQA